MRPSSFLICPLRRTALRPAPQQLRRSHLATQHTLALLPHLGRHLTALHADGGLRVLHGNCISLVAALVHRKTPRVIREESGACGRIRTGDLLITSELLCQLSHTSISMRSGSSPYSVYRLKSHSVSYHRSRAASTPIFCREIFICAIPRLFWQVMSRVFRPFSGQTDGRR